MTKKQAAANELYEACILVRKWLCGSELVDPNSPIANQAFIKANNAVLKALAKADGE